MRRPGFVLLSVSFILCALLPASPAAASQNIVVSFTLPVAMETDNPCTPETTEVIPLTGQAHFLFKIFFDDNGNRLLQAIYYDEALSGTDLVTGIGYQENAYRHEDTHVTMPTEVTTRDILVSNGPTPNFFLKQRFTIDINGNVSLVEARADCSGQEPAPSMTVSPL